MNRINGLSAITSCPHFAYIAGAFVVFQMLDETHALFCSPIISCVTCSRDALHVAFAHKNNITILKDKKHTIVTNGDVRQLVFSENGNYLVSVEDDGIYMYDRMFKLVASMPITLQIFSLEFDQNEDYLIIITKSTIQKWDIKCLKERDAFKKCRLLMTFRLENIFQSSKFLKGVWAKSGSCCIHAITDSGLLIVIREDLSVDRWVDVKMNNVNSVLCLQDMVVVGGTFTRGGNRPGVLSLHHVKDLVIAVIYSNRWIEFWDVRDIKDIYLLKSHHCHSDSILSLSRLSDTMLLTYSRDETIGFWNVQNTPGGLLVEMEKSIAVEQNASQSAFAVSSLHGIIAIGDSFGVLTIYKVDEFTKDCSIQAHESPIISIIISGMLLSLKKDARERVILATFDGNSNLKIFRLKDGLDLLQTIPNVSDSVNTICFCRGDQILVAAGECKVKYFHSKSPVDCKEYLCMKSPQDICDMVYDPGCDQLFAISRNRVLSVLSLEDGKCLTSYSWANLGSSIIFLKIGYNSATSVAAIACSDNSILLINVNNGKKLDRLFGHSKPISGLEFTADGKLLTSSGEDGILIAWNVTEDKIIRSYSDSTLNTKSMEYIPEAFPAKSRAYTKSALPSQDNHIIPQGRWALKVSHKGIILHTDISLGSPPVASFINKEHKRLSAEIDAKKLDQDYQAENHEEHESLLSFDVVHRTKWDFSGSIKLINQSESIIPPSSKTELPSPSVLDSLDLAGPYLVCDKDKFLASNHFRSKSEIPGDQHQGSNSVQAIGIIVKNDLLRDEGGVHSVNIGEVEDDDEIVDENTTKIEDTNGSCQKFLPTGNRRRERQATLGFVEAMIQQLERLRSEKVQNKEKISEIEEELSEIDHLIRGALKDS